MASRLPFLGVSPFTLRFRTPAYEAKFSKNLYSTVIWRGMHKHAAWFLAIVNGAMALTVGTRLPWDASFLPLLLLSWVPAAVSGWLGVRLHLDDKYYTRKVAPAAHTMRVLGACVFPAIPVPPRVCVSVCIVCHGIFTGALAEAPGSGRQGGRGDLRVLQFQYDAFPCVRAPAPAPALRIHAFGLILFFVHIR